MSFFNSITQNVVADDNNSTTANLAVDASFAGIATSTLGVVGLQFSINTDQNCTIYFDQSPDASNWDLSDEFNYYHDKNSLKRGDGWTVQAINSYWRIRILNIGYATTTYMRAQGVLCPIANPLPRSLASGGELNVETVIKDFNLDRHMRVSPTNELYAVERNRLVGKAFVGGYKDTNFWTETSTNGGYATINGDLSLKTETNAAGYVQYQSVHTARFIAGTPNNYLSVGRLTQDPSVGYKVHWGPYDASNGIFFLVQDASFGIGTRNGGVDSIIWNGDFNGILGSTIVTSFLSPKSYDIIYGGQAIEFYINDELIHRKTSLLWPPANTLNLQATMEIENTGSTENNEISIRGATIYRIGQLHTSPVYKYIEGATTTLLKYGTGNLHTILNLDDKGRMIVYDNNSIIPIDGSTQILADIDMTKAKYGMEFNCDFNYGLYIVTTDVGLKATIIYE